MKTKEVLQILKIHRQTLSRYVKEGKIKVIRLLNKNGIKVDKVYTDIKSGMTLDRKGFLSLLDDVQNNKIDWQELFEDLMQVVNSFSINMHSKKRLANRIIGTKDDTTES